MGVNGDRFVGRGRSLLVEAAPQIEVGLDGQAVEEIARLRSFGLGGAAQIAQGEEALVVAFLGVGIDDEEPIGGGERAGGIAGDTAQAGQEAQRARVVGHHGDEALGDGARGREAVGLVLGGGREPERGGEVGRIRSASPAQRTASSVRPCTSASRPRPSSGSTRRGWAARAHSEDRLGLAGALRQRRGQRQTVVDQLIPRPTPARRRVRREQLGQRQRARRRGVRHLDVRQLEAAAARGGVGQRVARERARRRGENLR